MKTWPDDRCAWLALYMIPGLGNIGLKNLVERFGSPERVLEAELPELVEVEGVRREIARKIVSKEFSSDPEEELGKVEKCGARIVSYLDPSYPLPLRDIHYPPMLLYTKGKDLPGTQTFVGIVGSRNPTHYGLKVAERIGFGLADRNVGVVSGLARGIDSAAHRGCLRGGGFTVAVLGTGIDVLYPSGNKKLLEQILERGAVISEFHIGTPPEAKNFPIRNRIISGLSRGVAVVEATKKSGSLITASFALDQGREVFAVPGSIDSFKSTGTHFLIKQGAKLIENADDILDEFGFRDQPAQESKVSRKDIMPQELDENERKIFEIIGDYPMHIDQIVRMSDMDTGEVSSILMKMELMGIVKQLFGKIFVR
ncbi:MAG: DNA-processing protein DprA [Thermodesulfobacteriota bacterium]|nr:DNA-processing protein DprA [Thermodesulfobacteriota bacterium]